MRHSERKKTASISQDPSIDIAAQKPKKYKRTLKKVAAASMNIAFDSTATPVASISIHFSLAEISLEDILCLVTLAIPKGSLHRGYGRFFDKCCNESMGYTGGTIDWVDGIIVLGLAGPIC